MNFEDLQRIAKEEMTALLDELPREVRSEVDSVPIFFEALPDESDVASGIAPDTLGFYDEGSPGAPTPRIRLWLENLWEYSEEDEEIFRDEIHITLLHEIGHFLGWDEDDLTARDLD